MVLIFIIIIRLIFLRCQGYPIVKALDLGEPMVLVANHDDHNEDQSVVGVDKKGFVCLCCKHGRHSCEHVKCITSMTKEETIPDSLVEMARRSDFFQHRHQNVYVRKPVSTSKISMETLPQQRSVYEGTFADAVMESLQGTLLVPDFDGSCCKLCGETFIDNFIWQPGVRLISRSFIKSVSGK